MTIMYIRVHTDKYMSLLSFRDNFVEDPETLRTHYQYVLQQRLLERRPRFEWYFWMRK